MSMSQKVLMGAALLKAKVTGKDFPFMINWAVTGRCNLRCKHCYGEYGVVQKKELPLPLLLETIDHLADMGLKRLTVEGGEPLFRPDIDQFLRYVHSKGIEMSLCTNGIYLEEHIEAVRETVDLCVFSLDGSEAYNDELRGKNTFQHTMKALEIAKKNSLNTLLFTCLIDKNLKDLDYLVHLAKDLRTYITFNIAVAQVNEHGEGERKKLSKVQGEEYRAAIRKIMEYKKQGYPIYYSDRNYLQALNWKDFSKEKLERTDVAALSKEDKAQTIPCFAGRRFAYIEADGNVYPCYQKVGEMKVKNIETDGIREAFEFLKTQAYCSRCYNLTLSELNLQSDLNIASVAKVIRNYALDNI